MGVKYEASDAKQVAESGRELFEEMTASFADVALQSKGEKDELVVPSFENVDELAARKPGVIPKMWTPEEDLVLRAAVEKFGEKNWREIAEELDGRNHLQCLQRWKKALRPGLVKGHWSKDEDQYLLRLMNDYAKGKWNWAKISENIPGRNAKQCRERWFLNLDPTINRGPWSDAEDAKLLRLHKEFKGRWSLIAKEMEGRTENSVKTRFHSLQRREVRSRGWLPEEDDVFVRGLLVYGRNYGLCARLLPARSRGQLKKRFPALLQLRPSLGNQVKMVEERIERGHEPMPIHEMLKKLQDERELKKQMNQREKQNGMKQDEMLSYPAAPQSKGNTRKHGLLKKQQSSWVEDFMQNCTEPYITPKMLPRTRSTSVLTDFLMEEPTTIPPYSFEAETEYRPPQVPVDHRSKQLAQKHSSLMVLDNILNNMEENSDMFGLGDGFNQDFAAPAQNTFSAPINTENTKPSSRALRHRESSGFSKLLFDEDSLRFDENAYQQPQFSSYNTNDGNSYKSHGLQKRWSSSWTKMPSLQSFSSLDMPVV